MRTRAQTVRLGVFVTVALGLLLTIVVVLSGTALLEQRDRYTIVFSETVSGLEVGAPVKLLGVRVGRIESFAVRSEETDVVQVEVSLAHGTPIRKNAQAQLSGSGLTGLMFVEIRGGTDDAELLPPGERIPAGPSLFGTLTGKAESIAIKTEEALNRLLSIAEEQNLRNLRLTLDNLQVTTASARGVLESLEGVRERFEPLVNDVDAAAGSVRDAGASLDALGTDGRKLVANLNSMTAENGAIDAMLAQARRTLATLEAVLGGDDATRTARDVRNALRSFTRTMDQLNSVISASSADVREIAESLRDTAEHLEEFAQSIREDPSLIIRPTREN
jgi:phospholipid/cholesterol/gamma-HCH transport system substrate-binding protein